MNEEMIPAGVVIKLFDQAKDANRQNTDAIKDLTRVVGELTKCIEKQPDLNVLASLSVNRSRDIEEIKTTMRSISDTSKKLLSRVIFMIAVVSVAFSLMVGSYYFVKSSVENIVEQRIDSVYKPHAGDED